MRTFNIISIALILFTTACGFHLRGVGQSVQPLPYQVWNIEKTQGLEEYLHDELKRHSVKIVHTNNPDVAQLRILQLEQQRDIGSLSRIGTVSEYLFSLKVSVQLSYQDKDIGSPIVISLMRRQSYSDNDLFGKSLEENILWQDMYQEAAKQIVRQLAFVKQ